MRASRSMVGWLLAVSAACQSGPKPPSGRPDHALLKGLEPPPTNAPLHSPRDSQPPAPPQLPPGPASAMMVLRGGKPFLGSLELTGPLSISAERIRIGHGGDSLVELLYRLPPQMPPLKGDSGVGSLVLLERSGPGGAARRVVLRGGRRLVVAESWQTEPQPVTLDLGDGVQLRQRAIKAGGQPGYTEVPLDVVVNGKPQAMIPIGRPTPVKTEAGEWMVFSEVSHLLTPRGADLDQVASGYVLRAWVVGGR